MSGEKLGQSGPQQEPQRELKRKNQPQESVQNPSDIEADEGTARKATDEIRPRKKRVTDLAQDEVLELKQKLEEVEMPEIFVEPEGKKSRWGKVIENKELGISYREKVIELPKHRQEETGIKRIRRRELLNYPNKDRKEEPGITYPNRFFYRKGPDYTPDGYKISYAHDHDGYLICQNEEIVKCLTDGRLPSEYVVTHKINASVNPKTKKPNLEIFKSELLYFQSIRPRHKGAYTPWYGTGSYNSDTGKIDFDKKASESFQEGDVYFTAIWIGENFAWLFGDPLDSPIFAFGNKNKAFVEYARAVLDRRKFILDHNPNEWIPALDYTETLENILNGKRIKMGGNYKETRMPAIKYPGIKPLRWCHAELAVIPTQRSLNILFFETGEGEEKSEEKDS